MLVKTRTKVRNRIHSILDKHGLRMPHPTSFRKKNVEWLRVQSLGFMDDAILRGNLDLLEALEEQARVIDMNIVGLAVEDFRVGLLMTMTGVGYCSAMLLLAEMGDLSHFGIDRGLAS